MGLCLDSLAHLREVEIEMADGTKIAFADPRRFGRIRRSKQRFHSPEQLRVLFHVEGIAETCLFTCQAPSRS